MRETYYSVAGKSSDEHLVFGWAWVANGTDGRPVVDSQGDAIEPEELEQAAYQQRGRRA